MLTLITLVGCKSIDVKEKPDFLPYMLKPVAFFPTKPPVIIGSVWPDLMNKLEKDLRNIPTIGRLTGIRELNSKLEANPKLRSAYKTFISTLTLTGISDKEIALKLKEEFNCQHFLLMNLISFPCTKECSSDEQWVIRLKLIEANTGEIIYQARMSHQLDEDEQNNDSYQSLAEKMISDVTAEFKKGFIVPWHRWRYEHMNKVSEINNRSEMGI